MDLRLRPLSAWRGSIGATRVDAADDRIEKCSTTRRSTPSSSPRRSSLTSTSHRRASRRASTRSSRSRSLRPSQLADKLIALAEAARPRAHVRADLPLQPAGARREARWSRAERSATSTSSRRAASTSGLTAATSASSGTSPRTTSRSCCTGSARRRSRCARPGVPRSSSGIADVAFITMTFASGIVANVELSWLAPSKLRRTVLVGSEKMVVYDDVPPSRSGSSIRASCWARPRASASSSSPTAPGTSSRPELDSCEPLVAELARLRRAPSGARTRRRQIHLAREVVRLTEAAERSLNAGGAEVQLGATPTRPRFARRPAGKQPRRPVKEPAA